MTDAQKLMNFLFYNNSILPQKSLKNQNHNLKIYKKSPFTAYRWKGDQLRYQ